MILADISEGRTDIGEVLLLIAAIGFAVSAAMKLRPLAVDAFLAAAGLCLLAVAWLVL